MAQENHIGGLPQLKKWLGKSRFAVVDGDDAKLLQKWFGADQPGLDFSLGRLTTGKEAELYTYAGQEMGRSYFLNRSYPRICPQCLNEDGYCHSAWDFSLVVACHRHNQLLVDQCDVCDQRLSWNRQQHAQCGCGEVWGQSSGGVAATSIETQFSKWVHQCIQKRYGEVVAPAQSGCDFAAPPNGLAALMTLLWPLSLNGGTQVAYALGTAAGYGADCATGLKRSNKPMRKAQQILEMANGLAEKIARSEPVVLRVSCPSAVVQLLSESACSQENAADRSLAHSILGEVLQYKKRMNWHGSKPHLSQLPLF